MSYALLRHLHIGLAVISISLFVARATLQFAHIDWRHWSWLRRLPHLNDTALLLAGAALAIWSHQLPWQQLWLGLKLMALLVYIGLGSITLRPGLSTGRRGLALLGSLLAVALIVTLAVDRPTL